MLNQVWMFLENMFRNNQFLYAGFVLGFVAAIMHQFKALPKAIWRKIESRFFIEVEIQDKDEAFLWMIRWLAEHPYGKERARLLSVITERPDQTQHTTDECGPRRPTTVDDVRDQRPRVILTPARGSHWFFYRRHLVYLTRGKEESTGGGDANSSTKRNMFQPELITLRILTRSRKIVVQLLEDARELTHPLGERRTGIMTDRYGDWSSQLKRRPRPIESVILRKGLMEELIFEIEKFQKREDWYVKRGIPYRLGVLLSGPPGSGKSSTIAAIASHFDMDLAILNLSRGGLGDDELRNLLSEVPRNSIVLIEDIDCVFNERQGTEDKDSKITFSGLLNAIDGVAAGEKRIMFMTSNHPEVLDPALVRPGRADLCREIGHPDKGQVCRLYERFFPDATSTETLRFIEALGDPATTSMAALQGLLMKHSEHPGDPTKNIRELVRNAT